LIDTVCAVSSLSSLSPLISLPSPLPSPPFSATSCPLSLLCYASGTIPYPCIDQSRLKVSEANRSSYRKVDDSSHIKSQRLFTYTKPTTLCIYKLNNFSLSILPHQTIKMPGVLGLSCLLLSLPCSLCYILISDHL
jgi:hypothetical protein